MCALNSENAPLPNPFELSSVHGIPDNPPILEALSQEISGPGFTAHRPNFPVCCPVVYHNIAKEIPQKYGPVIRISFVAARSFFWVLLATPMVQLFAHRIDSPLVPQWREMVMSVFLLLLLPAALLHSQYYPLYCALRDEYLRRGLVLLQFVVLFVHFFALIGVPGSGFVGVGYAIVAFRCGDAVTKALSVTVTVWHLVNLVLQIVVLALVMGHLR
jgi:hypothetical protein